MPKRIGLANAEGVSKQVGTAPCSKDRLSARVADRCPLRRPGLHPAHADDRQNVSEEEMGTWSRSRFRPARRGKAYDPRDLRPGDTVAREVMVPDTTM
ncbi:MAG: hypothetical protein ACLU0O_02210 [Collinsella sp.]